MTRFMENARKVVPAVVLAGAAACSTAEQPAAAPSITLGNAPAVLKEAYESCALGDKIEDYKLRGTDRKNGKDVVIFQFPLKITKNPEGIAAAREGKIAYNGVVARDTAATDKTTLLTKAPEVEYDESTGLVRHEIPRDVLKAQGSLVVGYAVRAEEVSDETHRAIDLSCGNLVVDHRGRIEPTTHTAQGGMPERIEVIIP